MEGVERTNAVITRFQQQRAGLRNLYAMDVDRKKNKNCYTCRGFGHLAKNCRNRGTGMNRKIETEDSNNLNEDGGTDSQCSLK